MGAVAVSVFHCVTRLPTHQTGRSLHPSYGFTSCDPRQQTGHDSPFLGWAVLFAFVVVDPASCSLGAGACDVVLKCLLCAPTGAPLESPETRLGDNPMLFLCVLCVPSATLVQGSFMSLGAMQAQRCDDLFAVIFPLRCPPWTHVFLSSCSYTDCVRRV
jgi:hypothetical protein